MKKLSSFIALVCIVNVLMIVSLLGYLYATGRLDKPKVQSISDLLRHQGTPEGLRAKLYDIMTPASQPATATGTAASSPALAALDAPGTAQERIDYVRKVLEQERLQLESEKQFLRDQHKLLDERQLSLQAAEAAFADQKKAFDTKLAGTNTKTDTAGFQKSMALFDELKPKQVKDLLSAMTPDEVARYLSAMEPDRAAKVMAEFKTPDEKIALSTILEKVRGVPPSSGTGAALGIPATQSASAASAGQVVP